MDLKGSEPCDFETNATGGACDNASEVVDGRERHGVVQMAGHDALKEHFVDQIEPPS